MKRIARIVFFTFLVLATAVADLHCWQRLRIWRFVQRSPDIVARIKIEPSNLNLSAVILTNTTTFNIGYAEFALPSSCVVSLYSGNDTYIIGKSDTFSFSFMAPVNILLTNNLAYNMRSSFAKSPVNHPLVQELSDRTMTDLDFLMHTAKQTTFPSLWQLMLMDKASLAVTWINAIDKGFHPYGCDGIDFFETEKIRGLVRRGQSDCPASAHVHIEELTRTRSVVFILNMRDQKTSNFMPLLLVFIKSFHFLGEGIPPKESLTKLIRSAGIKPQLDNTKSENSQ